jgi:hypothetical protein
VNNLKFVYFKLFLTIVSLAGSALVVSAGHRWQK